MDKTVIIVGITGATGSIYGIRMLQVLSSINNIETHLVISKAGKINIEYETDWKIKDIESLATLSYDIGDIAAPLSSGSFRRHAMIIAPCTIKTMSAIAHSYTDNLITRSADVTLKEKRKLVLMVRETPLHIGHIRNMERLAEIGAVIMPPVPAFYHKPTTIQEIIDQTIGKTLDILDIEHNLYARWSGLNRQ